MVGSEYDGNFFLFFFWEASILLHNAIPAPVALPAYTYSLGPSKSSREIYDKFPSYPLRFGIWVELK